MSVKWRRNKKVLKKFKVISAINKVKSKNNPRTFPISSRVTKWKHPQKAEFKIFKGRKWKELEPLIDVLEEKDEVVIVAEAKGVNKENLKIQLENQRLTLSGEALERRYRKSLNLPSRVIPNTMRTRYKNGVLEIRLKKAVEQVAKRVAD
ncbi:MAG: Hsp20/alpha crystallin family protein [Candidatus Bathyarchaeota archaeon]|nr:Hsp20/alpha crystallin family protein [Candidatus Bathyarchaeota archaeon]